MFVDGSYNAAYRHHSFQFDLNTENCSLLNALKKSLHLSRRKTCFAHPVLENFFFVYRGVSFETANRSSIPSNSFMRDNSNIPLPIAVLQQFFGLFSMRSTRLKIVFMFMPDILKYTPFRFFESHTYHGRKKPRQLARLPELSVRFYIPSVGEVCCSCSIRSSRL